MSTLDKQTAKLIGRISENLPEIEGDIIRVDRTTRLPYPDDWMREVMHPNLEAVGPAEYDLSKVELYLHDKQKDGRHIVGNDLYENFKVTDSLKNCLGLHDALKIQKKGIKVFRKLFGKKMVFCWKSVMRRRGGNLSVPYVCDGGDEVMVIWRWLGHDWSDGDPSARFAS